MSKIVSQFSTDLNNYHNFSQKLTHFESNCHRATEVYKMYTVNHKNVTFYF